MNFPLKGLLKVQMVHPSFLKNCAYTPVTLVQPQHSTHQGSFCLPLRYYRLPTQVHIEHTITYWKQQPLDFGGRLERRSGLNKCEQSTSFHPCRFTQHLRLVKTRRVTLNFACVHWHAGTALTLL